jgi:putative transcriptional regulator
MARHKLKALRGTRSQSEVAKELGITRQMLSAIEAGERTPSLELANKIATFYGVAIEDIFFTNNGNDTKPKPTGTEGR